ncbi:SDR family oxidoreductase [Nocardia brasiliensis]|uniref:SDR family oxidoreductase n=1 Tax=Nocardia brasiliensis TaxID=37326 RepID=UPI003D8C4394
MVLTMRRAALVTGAAGGIGSQICRQLAADGFDLTIAYHHNVSGAECVTDTCRSAGVDAAPARADLADPEQVRDLFSAHHRTFGRLDAFVHSAAFRVPKRLGQTPEPQWRRMFAVNADALHIAYGELAQRMSDGGRIIALSSAIVSIALPGSAGYGASKAAVEALTRVAARELGPRGITANSIQLGLVNTETARAAVPEPGFELYARQSASGRVGTPIDVAALVSYLASPFSGWLTSQTIRLDGGFLS